MKLNRKPLNIDMIDKEVQLKNSAEEFEEENFNISNYLYEIIVGIFFSFLLFLSWLSLKWLNDYQYIFTIHRYTNINFSIYFPIQIASFFLYIIDIYLIIIITRVCNYFIIQIILRILSRENNEIFNRTPKLIFIPIVINSILFYLGKLINDNFENRYYCYYIGFPLVFISLFCLLKINLEKNLVRKYFRISYENPDMEEIFEEYFYEILLAINLYYFFYVLCQIIYYFTSSLTIENYLGIIANLFYGIVNLYINLKLKSNIFAILIMIIFSGILLFQYSIRDEEREEINLGNGEKILSACFLSISFFETIYINIMKC